MNGEIQLKIKIKENLFGKITVKMEGTWEDFAPFFTKPSLETNKSIKSKKIKRKNSTHNTYVDVVEFMGLINPENDFISKKQFLMDYREKYKIAQPTAYMRYNSVEHLFQSKKEGRSVFVKLKSKIYFYTWKCDKFCGEMRLLRARSPVTWDSKHQAHCDCGGRKRLNPSNTEGPFESELTALKYIEQKRRN